MEKKDGVCQESVYSRIFRENAKALRNFLLYRCGDKDLAEDLMQESFLKLWRECANVPVEKARGFLYSVARNQFFDHLRHEQVVQRFQQAEIFPKNSPDAPDSLAESAELQHRIEKAIAELPEHQRIVFLMNRIDNMTYAEIAGNLDLSVKAVEKRMHGALLALKSAI